VILPPVRWGRPAPIVGVKCEGALDRKAQDRLASVLVQKFA